MQSIIFHKDVLDLFLEEAPCGQFLYGTTSCKSPLSLCILGDRSWEVQLIIIIIFIVIIIIIIIIIIKDWYYYYYYYYYHHYHLLSITVVMG